MRTCRCCGFNEILNDYNFCPKCGLDIWKDAFNLKDRKKAEYAYKESLITRLFKFHYVFIDKKTGELALVEYAATNNAADECIKDTYATACEAKRIIDSKGIKYTEKELFRAFKYAFEFNGYEKCNPHYLVKVFIDIYKIKNSKLSTSGKTRALGAYKKYEIDVDTAIRYAKKLVEINP